MYCSSVVSFLRAYFPEFCWSAFSVAEALSFFCLAIFPLGWFHPNPRLVHVGWFHPKQESFIGYKLKTQIFSFHFQERPN